MKRLTQYEKEFAKFVAKYGKQTVICEHTLRAEVLLVNATGEYVFDFRSTSPTKQLSEILLDGNDLFKAMGVRFNLAVRTAATPTAYVPQSFPNKIIFDDETVATPAGTFNPDHLEAVYNAGYIAHKKGDTTYLKALKLRESRFVSQTQQSSAANKSSTEYLGSGVIPLARPFNMIGTDCGETKLVIPGASTLNLQYTTAAHAGKQVIAIIELEGIIVSGGNKIVSGVAPEMV